MLILSRKSGQTIVIDGGIRLTVLEVNHDRVRIGVEAPAHTRVLRAELVELIGTENQAAVSSASGREDLPSILAGLGVAGAEETAEPA